MGLQKSSNIFDPIENELDQRVFKGEQPRPSVVSFIRRKIYSTLRDTWVDNPERYFKLFLTGSLTTFQYSDSSDCDISLYPDYPALQDLFGEDDPIQIRADLITIVTTELDGAPIPGSRHPLQDFVVNPDIFPQDLYKSGERSAWSFQTNEWFVPPERERTHIVSDEMPRAFLRAQDMADKLTTLLDAKETDAARDFYAQVHKKRSADEKAGLGDFSEGNIVYKWLLHQGLFDRLNNEAGLHIAKAELWIPHTAGEDVQVVYDYQKDLILLGAKTSEHSGSVVLGRYDGTNVHLYDVSRQYINPNYFKRLWLASYPIKPLKNVFFDGEEMTTRPSNQMTYTEILPGLVHNSTSPWRKGDTWKTWIKNEGIIVDFQFGDSKDDPVEGKVTEIDSDRIRVEVEPGEYRVLTNDILKQIKFKVRDDKRNVTSKTADWNDVDEAAALKKAFPKIRPATEEENAHRWAGMGDYHTGKKLAYHQLGDCKYGDCDYEFATEDRASINNAHGWFSCPQCKRTYNVRTSLGEKTSWWIRDPEMIAGAFGFAGGQGSKEGSYWAFRWGYDNGKLLVEDKDYNKNVHYDMLQEFGYDGEQFYGDEFYGDESHELYLGYGYLDTNTGVLTIKPESYDYGEHVTPDIVQRQIANHFKEEGYTVNEVNVD